MNYVDDGHVIDDLLQIARTGERITINWIPDIASQQYLTPRVQKSVANYKQWLPKLIENAGASIEVIREFRLIFFSNGTSKLEWRLIWSTIEGRNTSAMSCLVSVMIKIFCFTYS
jgi:hypothetical protein